MLTFFRLVHTEVSLASEVSPDDDPGTGPLGTLFSLLLFHRNKQPLLVRRLLEYKSGAAREPLLAPRPRSDDLVSRATKKVAGEFAGRQGKLTFEKKRRAASLASRV